MDIIEIVTDLIDEDKDQPRVQFDEESLEELVQSIQELGLLSPIKVRTTPDGRYKIIYGNRRYKACKALGRPTIPCIVSTVTDEVEIYLEQIAENLTRAGFTPIEEGEAFHKLLHDAKFSSSTKYLASKLGKPESYIKNKCELLKFGAAVKKLVISGTEIKKDKLTEDQLLPIKDLPIEHRDPLALIIARDELPVSDVKKIAKLFKSKELSDSTKSKLLYKTGQGLLETWSVQESNKAERAKAAEAKAAASKAAEESPAAVAGTNKAEAAPSLLSAPAAMAAAQAEPNPAGAPAATAAAMAEAAPIELCLQQLAASLAPHSPLTADTIASYEQLAPEAKKAFRTEVDQLLRTLELHLNGWRTVREALKPR
ncbi:ParB/RepB/Spo0J family partition protein [Paenibacillus filicis]|uniref:ParB/RepB/Spo0J family partition protein n=1 Tax=Paenibacillus gyeongsangnamensis TaxID=3388067 RepID=A0ABT4Q5Y1_9BACL|nr:ParB/RepB/Spo0J family partition protein [Paenibacillus filicis]MCZ8512211.1 ParB/RepB/Spo0J family partition protein [Paenibacillus filicis]